MEMYLIKDLASNYEIECSDKRVDDSIKELRVPHTDYTLFFNLVVTNPCASEGNSIKSVEVFDLAILDKDFQEIEMDQHILNEIETLLTNSIYNSY